MKKRSIERALDPNRVKVPNNYNWTYRGEAVPYSDVTKSDLERALVNWMGLAPLKGKITLEMLESRLAERIWEVRDSYTNNPKYRNYIESLTLPKSYVLPTPHSYHIALLPRDKEADYNQITGEIRIDLILVIRDALIGTRYSEGRTRLKQVIIHEESHKLDCGINGCRDGLEAAHGPAWWNIYRNLGGKREMVLGVPMYGPRSMCTP